MDSVEAKYLLDEATYLYGVSLAVRLRYRVARVIFYVVLAFAALLVWGMISAQTEESHGNGLPLMVFLVVAAFGFVWQVKRGLKWGQRRQFAELAVANRWVTVRVGEADWRGEWENGTVLVVPWDHVKRLIRSPAMLLMEQVNGQVEMVPVTAFADESSLAQVEQWAGEHGVPVRHTQMRINVRRRYGRLDRGLPSRRQEQFASFFFWLLVFIAFPIVILLMR